ncbi:MAG: glycosyltransferase family 2 protein [Planctomycetota bacterium]
MKVSIIIPTLNGGALFKEALARIFSQKMADPFEVVCVDSGSTDGTVEAAEEAGARVILIDQGAFNHGLTRNLGIGETHGEFVALTVQDALPFDDQWLNALVDAVEKDEKHAGSYSRQIPRPECNPIIRDRLLNWAACRPGREVQALRQGQHLEDLNPWERLKIISFDNVSSCIRRSVWEEIPFQARNFGEDVAWASEVIRNGYHLVYTPESAVIHSHNNTVWYEFKRIYADHQNLNRLIGLVTVPRPGHILRNGWGAYRHYRELIATHEKDSFKRLFYTLRAFFYAYMENLAQFLGARLHRYVDAKVGIVMSLDRWIKHGL